MIRQLVIALVLTTSLLAFGATSPAAADDSSLDNLGQEILESIQSFYPVLSTQMGIHHYDHRFTDYSSGSVRDMIKKLTDFEKRLYKYRNAKLSTEDRVTYELLKSNVDITLHDLKRIQWYKHLPGLYVDEAVQGLYFLLLSHHAPLGERVVTIIARMKAVPGLFETARKNISRPPKIWVEAAQAQLQTGIDFYQQAAGELMRQFPDRADEILKASTAAREAMTSYNTWLSSIPTGGDTDFAIGKDAFDYKLKHEYLLDYDSDSMLVLGEALFAEADSVYREYHAYVEADHQTGQEAVFMPSCFSKQDILDYYNWEVQQEREFLTDNDILSIPDDIAPVRVVETPPFLRSVVAGIAYEPAGPFDSVQEALFYVRPIPDDLDSAQLAARYRYVHRRGFKGSVVHEAYPGHHLQMQIAGMNPDPIRKWQMNLMAIEGWALYCEEMMYEEGLFGDEDPAQWLGILGGIRFRAARVIADVKLHTGRFTYDQCVDWMINALEIDTDSGKDYIRKEVRRYTYQPTRQMTYLIGKREIIKLRDAMMERDGADFSLADFHDLLLSQGNIPPALDWEIFGLKQP